MRRLITALIMVMVGAFVVYAAECPKGKICFTLQWDQNTEANLAGYKVYKRVVTDPANPPAYDFNNPVATVVKPTTGKPQHAMVEDKGVTISYVVTAYDTDGNESTQSNEVWLRGVPPPDGVLNVP